MSKKIISDRFKQLSLKIIIIFSHGLQQFFKLLGFFFFIPLKLLWKIFFHVFLINVYHFYLFLKRLGQKFSAHREGDVPIFSTKKPRSWWLIFFAKYLPLIFFCFFLLWTIIDNWQLKKITAEEIGSKNLLRKITTHPEDYEETLEITEGPLDISKEKISYSQGEVLSPNLPTSPPPAKEFSQLSQEGSVLSAPLASSLATAATRTEIIDYQVITGDTVSSIAEKFGVTINTVLWSNNLSYTSLIRPGQILKILPISGITHKVQRGENLAGIAKKYQADLQKIMEFNKLSSAADLSTGETLIIPQGIKPVTYTPRPAPSLKDIFQPSVISSGTRLQWPVISRHITQYFGWRHSGLDIGDKMGNPIYAAENGRVERAGRTSGYGYNIVINHGDGLKTLYGHASKLYVSSGETVSRGQVIGAVGSTGWSSGPHLHFEVIQSGSRKNPLGYIR